jgi:hypothetical protein
MRLLLMLSTLLLTGCGVGAYINAFSTEHLCDQTITRANPFFGEIENLDREITSRGTTCQAVYKSMPNNRLCMSSIVMMSSPPSGRRSPLDQEIQSRGINCHDLSWQSWQNRSEYRKQKQLIENQISAERWTAATRHAVGSIVQSTAQNAEALIIVGGAMSAASTPRAVGRLPNDDIPLSAGFICPLRSSAASGVYRNCSYDCAGGIVVQSVSASTFCPTSIRR